MERSGQLETILNIVVPCNAHVDCPGPSCVLWISYSSISHIHAVDMYKIIDFAHDGHVPYACAARQVHLHNRGTQSIYSVRIITVHALLLGERELGSCWIDVYRRPGFNCVVKQLRFWLFKVDCEFKDCDLRMLRIGHTCVIYTLRSNNCELREKSQSLNYAIETRPTV